MTKSTFTGKSTVDTIRNYAEILIDDINGNQPENLSSHWTKAREMDNKLAKQIFSQEYGDRIGQAYYYCIKKYKIRELKRCWKDVDSSPTVALTMANEKIQEITGLIDLGILMAPISADLHCAAAWAYVVHMGQGKPEGCKHKLQPSSAYELYKSLALSHLSHASSLSPNNKSIIGIKEILTKLDRSKSGCFIATAAYGTPFAEEIEVLRNWRDDFLEVSSPGRAFIKAYYSMSPPVADNISESGVKRKFVRTLLSPVVKVLKDRYSY